MSRYPDSILQGEEALRLAARRVAEDKLRADVGDESHELEAGALGDGGFWFVHEGRRVKAYACAVDGGVQVRVDGKTHFFASAERDREGGGGERADPSLICAPMTGTIVKVLCEVGDRVEAEQDLVVLSAMKMEHKLSAASSAVVEAIEAETGATVDAGAVLIRLEVADEG